MLLSLFYHKDLTPLKYTSNVPHEHKYFVLNKKSKYNFIFELNIFCNQADIIYKEFHGKNGKSNFFNILHYFTFKLLRCEQLYFTHEEYANTKCCIQGRGERKNGACWAKNQEFH